MKTDSHKDIDMCEPALAQKLAALKNVHGSTAVCNDNWVRVRQPAGPELGFSPDSGVRIIERDGLLFKSFNGKDELLPYADWRLPAEERAADLASRMAIEQIAGLMLYSPQNRVPMENDTYNGAKFSESGQPAWALSDSQRHFLLDDNVRHLLVSVVKSGVDAARWNNRVQALVEGAPLRIPANNSSDPRHSAFADAEFAPGCAGQLSQWSNLLGLASTFDPATVEEFGRIASEEYRLMGLATALSPQADLGTDPRWYRFNATFGNDPALVTDIVRAYASTFQSSDDTPDSGWGKGSVNAMVKHWPGGGSGEGGRDAHYGNGKFAVYPGNSAESHLRPFLEGAFRLDGGTNKASAVMPYYTISYGLTDEAVDNSFNKRLITDMLRGEAGYDGVVCTDWCITADQIDPGTHSGKPWGVETLTVAERHYRALQAGVDQFGGNNEKQPVLDAYAMGCLDIGEPAMRERMERSARRLLLNILRTGLFENPYVDIEAAAKGLGSPDKMKAGYRQQLRSVIMLKNHAGTLPLNGKKKVYVPRRHDPAIRNYWGTILPPHDFDPVPAALATNFYEPVDDPASADAAIVFIESPKSYGMGYDARDKLAGGNGYIPITLQYRPYTATTAREHSLATDCTETPADRSYRGKTALAQNECHLDMLAETRRLMGDKPVIVVLAMSNPTVMSEVEPLADAILTGFDVQTQAYLDLIFGNAEPNGLLPFEMPASMEAVEAHCEDKPHDIEPYCDADGNIYRFGFGLDWKGEIDDERVRRYRHDKQS